MGWSPQVNAQLNAPRPRGQTLGGLFSAITEALQEHQLRKTLSESKDPDLEALRPMLDVLPSKDFVKLWTQYKLSRSSAEAKRIDEAAKYTREQGGKRELEMMREQAAGARQTERLEAQKKTSGLTAAQQRTEEKRGMDLQTLADRLSADTDKNMQELGAQLQSVIAGTSPASAEGIRQAGIPLLQEERAKKTPFQGSKYGKEDLDLFSEQLQKRAKAELQKEQPPVSQPQKQEQGMAAPAPKRVSIQDLVASVGHARVARFLRERDPVVMSALGISEQDADALAGQLDEALAPEPEKATQRELNKRVASGEKTSWLARTLAELGNTVGSTWNLANPSGDLQIPTGVDPMELNDLGLPPVNPLRGKAYADRIRRQIMGGMQLNPTQPIR